MQNPRTTPLKVKSSTPIAEINLFQIDGDISLSDDTTNLSQASVYFGESGLENPLSTAPPSISPNLSQKLNANELSP